MTDRSALAFQDKAGETLEDKALRFSDIIISFGLGIRGGHIELRNTHRIQNAVDSIDPYLAQAYSGSSMLTYNAFGVVGAIQSYLNIEDATRLTQAASYLAFMKSKCKWQTDAKPLNLDLNAAGAKMFGYREPEGVAKDLVDAFDIGFKTKKPQPKA